MGKVKDLSSDPTDPTLVRREENRDSLIVPSLNKEPILRRKKHTNMTKNFKPRKKKEKE